MSEQTDQPAPYGARGEDYALWRAREAVAQAEKLLASQAATMAYHEGRATSLIGWVCADLLAVAGMLGSHPTWPWVVGSIGVVFPSLMSGYYLYRVYQPKEWSVTGIRPEWLMRDWPQPTERTTLESIAGLYIGEVARNEQTLHRAYTVVRKAWIWFLRIPVIGLIWMVLFAAEQYWLHLVS
ncbi:hypothetical protein KSAC_08730 [Komagataeibacter saccharivorans]|uniref:hypothetical protein n=1 Tax=Komagataeibacter saccharivorans TaxID=265959 RepID=UPI0010535008|nr:hypothetical protein [Komagataeibacter saccharivorans]QBL93114.1 hypothetical protein KSAC_08730 [Komagataeibacter saccharivorans]